MTAMLVSRVGPAQCDDSIPKSAPVFREPVAVSDATVQGVVGVAIVDTGFSAGLMFDHDQVDFDKAGNRRTEVDLFTNLQQRPVQGWESVSFEVAGHSVAGVVAVRSNMDDLRRHFQHEFIVGMQALNGCTMSFGPQTRGVSIRDGGQLRTNPRTLQVRRSVNGSPEVPIDIPVLGNIHVLLDTGSSGTVKLRHERLEFLVRCGVARRVNRLGMTVDALGSATRTDSEYVVRRISVGPCVFHDVRAKAARIENIGMGLLRYFTVTLDFASDLALFEPVPPDRKEIRPAIPAAGFIPAPYGADPSRPITVDIVEADSPASRAGLVHGDIIHQIDGQPVAGMSWWDRIDVFAEVGRTRRLTVERDGKELLLDLKLAHNFSWPIEWPPEKPEFSPEPCGGP
jgi:hypothetical protein